MFLGKGVHFKDHIVTAALLQWHGEGGGRGWLPRAALAKGWHFDDK